MDKASDVDRNTILYCEPADLAASEAKTGSRVHGTPADHGLITGLTQVGSIEAKDRSPTRVRSHGPGRTDCLH